MTKDKQTEIFAANLNRYMEMYGKTQTDLIIDLGVNRSTISTWCRGEKMPRMGTIQTLADYFGVRKSDMIEEHSATEKQDEQDLIELREEMRRKPGLRLLFSLTKNASNEDIEAVAKLMEHFKGED